MDSQRLHQFESFLAASSPFDSTPLALTAFRHLAYTGVPDHPPLIRPLAWKILLGTLGTDRRKWNQENGRRRNEYYDFVRDFCQPNETSAVPESPTSPASPLSPSVNLSPDDSHLLTIHNDVVRTQRQLAFFRQPIPANRRNPLSPPGAGDTDSESESGFESGSEPRAGTIECRRGLFERLEVLTRGRSVDGDFGGDDGEPERRRLRVRPPDIQIMEPSPSSPTAPHSFPPTPASPALSDTPTITPSSSTSLSINVPSQLNVPDTHSSALIRILYLTSRLHPTLSYVQGENEVLAPLYYACASPPDAPHAEADTFAMFQTLVGEFREIWGGREGVVAKGFAGVPVARAEATGEGGEDEAPMEEKRGMEWALAKLGRRVRWADEPLWLELKRKHLDPSTPYYAFRWIHCLLAQEFVLPDLLRLWDSLFSHPSSSAEDPSAPSPRIEYLIDVCAAMILLLRPQLMERTEAERKGRGLWDAAVGTGQDEDEGPGGEGFARGMQLLQNYPSSDIGVDRILQLATEVRERRLAGAMSGTGPDDPEPSTTSPSSTWQLPSLPRAPNLRRKLWRTSGTSTSPSTDIPDDASEPGSEFSVATAPPGPSSEGVLGRYARRFQASDSAARLSKASSNFAASAMAAWNGGAGAGASGAAGTWTAPVASQPQRRKPRRATAGSWSSWGAAAGKMFTAAVEPAPPPPLPDLPSSSAGRYASHRDSTISTRPPPSFMNERTPSPENSPRSSAAMSRRDSEASQASSTTSAASVTGTPKTVSSKLANFAESIAAALPAHTASTPSSKVAPRPLLLGSHARSASKSGGISPTPAPPANRRAMNLTSPRSSLSGSEADLPPVPLHNGNGGSPFTRSPAGRSANRSSISYRAGSQDFGSPERPEEMTRSRAQSNGMPTPVFGPRSSRFRQVSPAMAGQASEPFLSPPQSTKPLPHEPLITSPLTHRELSESGARKVDVEAAEVASSPVEAAPPANGTTGLPPAPRKGRLMSIRRKPAPSPDFAHVDAPPGELAPAAFIPSPHMPSGQFDSPIEPSTADNPIRKYALADGPSPSSPPGSSDSELAYERSSSPETIPPSNPPTFSSRGRSVRVRSKRNIRIPAALLIPPQAVADAINAGPPLAIVAESSPSTAPSSPTSPPSRKSSLDERTPVEPVRHYAPRGASLSSASVPAPAPTPKQHNRDSTVSSDADADDEAGYGILGDVLDSYGGATTDDEKRLSKASSIATSSDYGAAL